MRQEGEKSLLKQKVEQTEAELKAALETAEEKNKELQAIETILRRSHHE